MRRTDGACGHRQQFGPRFGRVRRPAAKYAPDSAASRRRRLRMRLLKGGLQPICRVFRGCGSGPPRPRVEICRRRRTAARRRPQPADPICGPHVRALRPRRRCPPPLARGCACFGRAQGGPPVSVRRTAPRTPLRSAPRAHDAARWYRHPGRPPLRAPDRALGGGLRGCARPWRPRGSLDRGRVIAPIT